MLKEHKWWIILVWVTILVFVAVSKVDTTIRNFTTLSLAPITSTIPVQVSKDPTADTQYVVPMGNNTVWIIHPNQQRVITITQNNDGTINATSRSYTLGH